MLELYKQKAEAVQKLKSFTREIMSLSVLADYEKIQTMLSDREKYFQNISAVDDKINSIKCKSGNPKEAEEINSIKSKIRNSVREIINMDKIIRRNVSEELKDTEGKLNRNTDHPRLVNIKA